MAVPPRPHRPPRRCPARRAIASRLVRRRRRLARALRYRLRAMGATTRRRRFYMAIPAVRGQPARLHHVRTRAQLYHARLGEERARLARSPDLVDARTRRLSG